VTPFAFTFPQLAAAVLWTGIAALFVLSVFYSVRLRLRRARATPSIFRCTVCGHVYFDRRNVPMSECPKCGSMNEIIKGY
jgi:Zn finger protein HypA/HybF involved in hydrogenase expression